MLFLRYPIAFFVNADALLVSLDANNNIENGLVLVTGALVPPWILAYNLNS